MKTIIEKGKLPSVIKKSSIEFRVLYIVHSPPNGLAVTPRMDLHSVWVMHHIKQVEYVESQDNYVFLTSLCLLPFNFRCRYVWLYQCKLTKVTSIQSIADFS
jgi:hypothetical protein